MSPFATVQPATNPAEDPTLADQILEAARGRNLQNPQAELVIQFLLKAQQELQSNPELAARLLDKARTLDQYSK